LDPLTGLANRRAIEPVVQSALAELRLVKRACALAMLDIDEFKLINDRHSHVVGDAVLRALGDVMRAALRAVDFAARTGGDEIVILFSGATEAEARAACERIRRRIAEYDWTALSPGLTVTMSVGVTAALAGDSFETLMRRADDLMYQHKAA
jgi:diguanylate cyclase (GGDEF)-like protein